MDKQLEMVVDSQAKWSATANALKGRFEWMRKAAFLLSILGALLAALASQLDGRARLGLALASSLAFLIVTFITAHFLNAVRAEGWARARRAAEALKREAYKYASRAAPYDDPATSAKLLAGEVSKIEKDVEDLLIDQVQGSRGSSPFETFTPTDYTKKRVSGQITWFEDKALDYQRKARRLRSIEIALAFVTAVITGIVGFIEKQQIMGVDFDFAALVAVLTTISGTIVAYIEASRYESTVTAYRATAGRLKLQLVNEPPASTNIPSLEWSAFVEQSEAILQEENSSWMVKSGKPS